MRIVTTIVAFVCALVSVAMIVPSPVAPLYSFNVFAPEIAPAVLVIALVLLIGAKRLPKALTVMLACSAVVSAWPCIQYWRFSAGMPALKTTLTLPVRGPERLPMNIVLHRPNDSVARPIFIDMYGGSWQRGTPHGAGRFHRLMASRGYAVFAIDYRHAPEHRFPAQLDDVQAAIAFIEENAGRYYADSKRVVLCGRSAGAHLALLAAYRPDSVPVNAVIAFYPPTDLAQGYDELPVPNPINVRYVLDQFLGGPPEKFPDAYRFASPSTYVRAGLPPTLLIHGGRDHVVKPEFSRAMHQRLVDAGNTSRLIEIPWAEHAFDAVWFGLGNRVAQPSIDSFLQTHAPAETKREP